VGGDFAENDLIMGAGAAGSRGGDSAENMTAENITQFFFLYFLIKKTK